MVDKIQRKRGGMMEKQIEINGNYLADYSEDNPVLSSHACY